MKQVNFWLALPLPWLALGTLFWLMTVAGGDATFTVNDTADATDADPGDGVCETAAGNNVCTLRAAVQESNALPGTDTIILPAGTFTLTIPGNDEDAAVTGDLDINREVIIIGAGPDHTFIDGGGLDRVFHIMSGFKGATSLSGLSVRNGAAETGGGLSVVQSRVVITASQFSANTAEDAGGGIYVASSFITLTETTIDDNTVTGTSGNGGGVSANGSTISFYKSVIYSNTVPSLDSFGGGLQIFGWSTIVNTTFSGNQAADGGAIRFGIGEHVLTNTTIANNTAFTGGGIFDDPLYSGPITLVNSIVANNTPTNCDDNGQIFSGGHNLDSGQSCNFNAPGDLTNSDPLLGPLQNNGGPTWTQALTPSSPAVDAADIEACPPADQRGTQRPTDGDGDGTAACDIGAYELTPYRLYLPVVLG